MACTSSCRTQDHRSYGECLRDKALHVDVAVPGTGYDPAKQKAWDSELDLYRHARSQGIQPASTKRPAIEAAIKASDSTGTAFQAG